MKFHHIGYAVHSLDKAIESFKYLGCNLVSRCLDETRGIEIAFIADAEGTQIELIEPVADGNPVQNILKKIGPAPYHLCFETTESPSDALTMLAAAGFNEIRGGGAAPALEGSMVKFFYSSSLGIVELYFVNK